VSVLFCSESFEFGERLPALGIGFCSLIDQFLIAPSGALGSLYGFWVFSEEIKVDHPSRVLSRSLEILRPEASPGWVE
jgi:hypothetical protein